MSSTVCRSRCSCSTGLSDRLGELANRARSPPIPVAGHLDYRIRLDDRNPARAPPTAGRPGASDVDRDHVTGQRRCRCRGRVRPRTQRRARSAVCRTARHGGRGRHRPRAGTGDGTERRRQPPAAPTRPVAAGTPLAGVQLRQGHCPVQHVAAQFPAFCDAETDAFSRLLGVHVQRLATLAHGEHVCTTFIPISAVPITAQSATITSDERSAP